MEKYYLPLLFATLAGISTIIGGFVTFFIKRKSMRALSIGLGFSAGVMIFISLSELLPSSQEYVTKIFGASNSWITVLSFVVGIVIAILIDYFIPDHIKDENHYITDDDHENDPEIIDKWKKLKRAGLMTAVAVAIHNFPEGLATFFATTVDIKLGLAVVVAISIHNIPEGIAIALPVYQATGSKRKAFYYTVLSGLSEPVGGAVGFLLINMLFPDVAIGLMFAVVAGIMTYISFDTLIPLSREYDTGHCSITGVVLGMIFIALTIYSFGM